MRTKPRKNDIPLDKHKDVIAYYVVLGKTLMDIAKTFDVTTYVVNEVLELNNIPKRKPGPKPGTMPKVNLKRQEQEISINQLDLDLSLNNQDIPEVMASMDIPLDEVDAYAVESQLIANLTAPLGEENNVT